MILKIGNEKDREVLGPIRAEEWKKSLSVEEFCERNRRLYSHSFGKTITTYLAVNEAGEVLSSMDSLPVPLLFKDASGKIKEEEGFLIASVVTPKSMRGKGYAAKMLSTYFGTNPKKSGVLYSDIGPPYYEKFGFRVNPRVEVTLPQEKVSISASSISLEKFVTELGAIRRKEIEASSAGTACLLPSALFLDWQIQRFKVAAELRNASFPPEVVWNQVHGGANHLVLAVPHSPSQSAYVLWVTPGCTQCVNFVKNLGFYWKMPEIKQAILWAEPHFSPNSPLEYPMLLLRDSASPTFLDPQLCDWW